MNKKIILQFMVFYKHYGYSIKDYKYKIIEFWS